MNTFAYLLALFVENRKKVMIVSRANSIGSTSASSVPNTGNELLPFLSVNLSFLL